MGLPALFTLPVLRYMKMLMRPKCSLAKIKDGGGKHKEAGMLKPSMLWIFPIVALLTSCANSAQTRTAVATDCLQPPPPELLWSDAEWHLHRPDVLTRRPALRPMA